MFKKKTESAVESTFLIEFFCIKYENEDSLDVSILIIL